MNLTASSQVHTLDTLHHSSSTQHTCQGSFTDGLHEPAHAGSRWTHDVRHENLTKLPPAGAKIWCLSSGESMVLVTYVTQQWVFLVKGC